MILLHGWGLSGQTFFPLSKILKKAGYEVYTPDLPGFGEEEAPQNPWHLSNYADFIDKFIKTHELPKAVIIGHSFGGRVALKFTQLYPDSVKAIILSGTPGYTPAPQLQILFYLMVAKIGAYIFSMPLLSKIKDRARLWLYYIVGSRDFYRAQPQMRQTFKNIVQEKLDPSMQKLTVPCLLLWGANDTLVPVTIARRMKVAIKNSKLIVIKGADHRLPYAQPKLFTKFVTQFLIHKVHY